MRLTIAHLLQALAQQVALPEPIVEVGSRRVLGQLFVPSTRELMGGRPSFGSDLEPGSGVSHLQDAHRLGLRDSSVGTFLMLDTIEHIREPWVALSEVRRCLKPGGLLLLSSVWYFPIHAFPDDYWRFTASGFRVLLTGFEEISVVNSGLKRLPHTVVGLAGKSPIAPEARSRIERVVEDWERNRARSWKETVADICPPVLLGPGYGGFLRLNAFYETIKRWRW